MTIEQYNNRTIKHRGFSLVELLVSVAIITVISGATLVYFRGGNKNWALTRTAQRVSQEIRRASNMALSSPGYTCPESAAIDGYGICFSSGGPGADFCANDSDASNASYILFVDCDGNNAYGGTGVDVKIETISVESGVKVKTVIPVYSFSVVFVPPDPTTNFSSGTSGTITLSLTTDESTTKQLTINSKGNIDIQ